MKYQNLFEAIQNVCGHTPLESEMFEIIAAYEKDRAIANAVAICDHKQSVCKCKGGAVGRTVTSDFEHQICDRCGNIA